jgi:hypothetical protein
MEVATSMQKSKSGSFTRVPKVSRTSKWILSAGAFLIIFFLLFFLAGREQKTTESLQQSLAGIQKASAPTQDFAALQDVLAREQAQFEQVQSQFPGQNSTVQMVDNFMKLAKSCGIEITGSSLGTGTTDISGAKAAISYNSHNYTLQLTGEVARIQNFILGLSKFPTTKIKEITITPSAAEATMDTAVISVDTVIKDR